MEDDEDYNRKYHASSHPQPQHHISEDQQAQHDMYLPPMPHPQDNEQLNEALHLHYQLQQQQAQQHAQQQIQQQQLQQMQQLYAQHEIDKNGYSDLHSLFGQDPQQPQREEHQPSPTALNPTSNRISVQYGNEQYTSVDGQLYNDRGYKICGHLNQHNRPCQRIGRCPFHDKLREDEQEASATGDEQQQTEQPATAKKQRTKQEPPHMIQVTPIDESQLASQTPVKKVPFKQGWNKEEHMRFLTGLQTHGKGAWKEIAMIVGTRTPTQIQSHAQKYFLRQKQKNKNKRSIHDFTMDDLNKMSRGPSETDTSLIDFNEEQEEPVDNTKKRKQKATPTQKRKKRKTSYDEEEDEQPMQASQEITITPPAQTPEQQALFQQQMQQLLQGQIGQMIANGQLDQNQILSSYASLAMLIQNKFGELQQQLQTTTAAPPSEPSSPETKNRQPFAS
jgi:SHAQKYF class myb-like DNA-binding protein